jgi:Domain of unknown function (DUF4874)/Domain of unknown function (DUF4832)
MSGDKKRFHKDTDGGSGQRVNTSWKTMLAWTVAGLLATAASLSSADAQPVMKALFSPNPKTISTSEGAPYGDCDFWTKGPSDCNKQSNFGYGPTKIVRLYICLSGEVVLGSCSQQPAVSGPLSQARVNRINAGIAGYAGTGIRLIIRFVYNFGDIGPAAMDAPISVILAHVDQLAPALLANKDLIFALEAGFIGTWGEWHHSTNGNDSAGAHKALLDKELSYFSGLFPILIRYPGDLLLYAGASARRPELGIHNDYYASNVNDGSTWIPCSPALGYCVKGYTVARMMSYAAAISAKSVYAGEFGAAYPKLQNCDALDKYSALFHLQSISLYPDPPAVAAGLRKESCAASFFDQVGTRIVLKQTEIRGHPTPGGSLSLALTMVNAGYGRVVRQRPATLILSQNGQTIARIPIPANSLDLGILQRNKPKTFRFKFTLPQTLVSGPVSAALFIPDPAPSLSSQAAYALPLNSLDQSNRSIFDPATGYNLIGPAFTISPAHF